MVLGALISCGALDKPEGREGGAQGESVGVNCSEIVFRCQEGGAAVGVGGHFCCFYDGALGL